MRKNRRLNLYFRRQHPVGRFIVDFYCHEIRLAIEVDGSVHDSEEQHERDANRTACLEEFGIKVLRFRNEDIIRNSRKVAEIIEDEVESRWEMPG